MNCGRCQLPLHPGSAHVNAESCVEALRHELDKARTCAGCRKPLLVVVCPPCAATTFGQGLLARAAKGIKDAATPGILRLLSGEPAAEDDGKFRP